MANEDVSRIMQSKPELRYSPAFVYIKALSWLAMSRVPGSSPSPRALSIRDISAACLRMFWNYIARGRRPTSLVNSRHILPLTMCILSTRYIAICQVRLAVRAQFRALSRAPSAIFRPVMTIRVRDLSWTDIYRVNNEQASQCERNTFPKIFVCVFLNNVAQHSKICALRQFKQTLNGGSLNNEYIFFWRKYLRK